MMSLMVLVTFLIVTAFAMCGGVEAASSPKDAAINGVTKNIIQEERTVICPPGYEPVEIYCYKINLQLGQQRQHQDLCFQSESGGYLIASEENAALERHLSSLNLQPQDSLYIGLMNMHWGTIYDPEYSWMNIMSDLSYTNWAAGQPIDKECTVVRIFLSGDNFGKWATVFCQRLRGAICEADPLSKLNFAVTV